MGPTTAKGHQPANADSTQNSSDSPKPLAGHSPSFIGAMGIALLTGAGFINTALQQGDMETPKMSINSALGLPPDPLIPRLDRIADPVVITELTADFFGFTAKTEDGETISISRDSAYVMPGRDDEPETPTVTKCKVTGTEEVKYYIVWNGDLADPLAAPIGSNQISNENSPNTPSVAAALPKGSQGPSGAN